MVRATNENKPPPPSADTECPKTKSKSSNDCFLVSCSTPTLAPNFYRTVPIGNTSFQATRWHLERGWFTFSFCHPLQDWRITETDNRRLNMKAGIGCWSFPSVRYIRLHSWWKVTGWRKKIQPSIVEYVNLLCPNRTFSCVSSGFLGNVLTTIHFPPYYKSYLFLGVNRVCHRPKEEEIKTKKKTPTTTR